MQLLKKKSIGIHQIIQMWSLKQVFKKATIQIFKDIKKKMGIVIGEMEKSQRKTRNSNKEPNGRGGAR